MKRHRLDNPLGRNVKGQIECQMENKTRSLFQPFVSGVLKIYLAAPRVTTTAEGERGRKRCVVVILSLE
jgi:hypothetical protein